MSNPNKPATNLTREELRQAIRKDFHKLLVKEFTADWKIQRLLHDLELDVMYFDNTMQLFDTYTQAKERETLKSDEHHLHRYFHYYLETMYKKHGLEDVKYMFMDGFEEPLEPGYLCDAIYELAERLGYKLENNMWVEMPELKKEKEDL